MRTGPLVIAQYTFWGPHLIGKAPEGAGVYAVLTHNGTQHILVYVDCSENFKTCVVASHRRAKCWDARKARGRLEVFVYPLRWDEEEWERVKNDIIKHYISIPPYRKPSCNS